METPAASQMTLRDHFAGLAMASLIRIGASSIKTVERRDGSTFEDPDMPYYFGAWEHWSKDKDSVEGMEGLAAGAYDVADAMIAEKMRRDRLEQESKVQIKEHADGYDG